jgi:hypothetical protein
MRAVVRPGCCTSCCTKLALQCQGSSIRLPSAMLNPGSAKPPRTRAGLPRPWRAVLLGGRACRVAWVSDLGFLAEVGGEAVGEVQGQGAEGLLPALDDGVFDEPGGGLALVPGAAFLGGAGALVLDIADGQPQQLDDGVVAGEVAAVLDDLAELVVQRLELCLLQSHGPRKWLPNCRLQAAGPGRSAIWYRRRALMNCSAVPPRSG